MNTVEADPGGWGAMRQKASARNKRASALRPLLTNERSQKFDLLLHLISNIQDGIVICGPSGIGKSTILNLVQAAKLESWSVCRINATSATRFSDIRTALAESIFVDTGGAHQKSTVDNLEIHLSGFYRDDKFLVLLLDDAGEMTPGVITAVCRFADSNRSLRPVFTMTADRLHLSLSSDPAVGNCQVIEIPPLTESQCGAFLQNLSGKPGALISFKAISPSLIEHVYRRSHGVPGHMLAILPELSNGDFVKIPGSSLPMVAAITLIGAIFVGYLLWNTSDDSTLLEKIFSFSGTQGTPPHPMARLDQIPVQTTPEHRAGANIDAHEPHIEVPIQPGGFGQNGTGHPFGAEKDPFFGFSTSSLEKALRPFFDRAKMLSNSALNRDRTDGPGVPFSKMPSDAPTVVDSGKELQNRTNDFSHDQLLTQPRSEEQFKAQATVRTGVGVLQPDENADSFTAQAGEPNNAKLQDTVTAEIEMTESQPLQAESGNTEALIDGVRGLRWIRQQNPRWYTLQLLAVTKVDDMKKFLDTHSELDGLAIFKTRRGETYWYALITGVYPSLSEAKKAARQLPVGLQNAWPRTFESVQNAMIGADSE